MSSPAPTPPSAASVRPELADDLALALTLADAADAVSMSRFDASDLDVRTKSDRTPVTEADLAVERAIREILATERPDDGILGEEFGVSESAESGRQWIIDPIDGTANYLKGIPMWTTLIALAVDGVPEVGVVSQPAIGRRWWGAMGHGSWTTGSDGAPRRLAVSTIDTIAESSVSFQSIAQWDDVGRTGDLLRLTRAVWRDRGYGDTWPYMLLAEGRLELVAEFGVQVYDVAALVPIVREAGGRFTSIAGTDDFHARSSLATNGILHDEFLRLLDAGDETS